MKNSFIHLTSGYKPNENIRLKLAIVGAPGSGKSTLASGLLYFSKLFFFKSDSVPEVAKWYYYKGHDFSENGFELKKFNEQKNLEDIYPTNLEVLICEAPLIISAVYSAYYYGDESPVAMQMFELAQQSSGRYTHFILSKKLIKFEAFGRNENEKQAEELHSKTIEVLERLKLDYILVDQYDEHIPLQILAKLGAITKD